MAVVVFTFGIIMDQGLMQELRGPYGVGQPRTLRKHVEAKASGSIITRGLFLILDSWYVRSTRTSNRFIQELLVMSGSQRPAFWPSYPGRHP